jgi:hypothetical protein
VQYKVPQNIDQEDKILGPLTFIEFIYVLIGGAIVILALALFDTALFLLVAIPTIVLTACFALIKVQNQPFSRFFVYFFVYLTQPKRRIWHDAEAEVLEKQNAINAEIETQKQAKRKSKDIAPAARSITSTQSTIKAAAPRRSMDTIGVSRTITPTPTPARPVTPQPPVQPKQPITIPVQPATPQGGR